MSIHRLSPRQQEVLQFIREYNQQHSHPPTLIEIKQRLKINSVSTAHKHVVSLRRKGALQNVRRHQRVLTFREDSSFIELPKLGYISAGSGIEPIEYPDTIRIFSDMVNTSKGQHYILEVRGNSMIGDGIKDGDLVIIRSQSIAQNGDTVVAILNEGSEKATLKKFYYSGDQIELKAENPNLSDWPKKFNVGEIEVRGKLVGLIRKD